MQGIFSRFNCVKHEKTTILITHYATTSNPINNVNLILKDLGGNILPLRGSIIRGNSTYYGTQFLVNGSCTISNYNVNIMEVVFDLYYLSTSDQTINLKYNQTATAIGGYFNGMTVLVY